MGVATLTTVTAFAPPATATAASQGSTAVWATVEDSTTTLSTQLIPPQSPEEIASQHRVSDMYDINVQKTYGYVKVTTGSVGGLLL